MKKKVLIKIKIFHQQTYTPKNSLFFSTIKSLIEFYLFLIKNKTNH